MKNQITNYKLPIDLTTGFFVESNVHKKNYNQKQGSSNLRISIGTPKVIHFLSNSFSTLTVINKNIIPRIISQVNTIKSHRLDGKNIFDPINGTINQAADILIDNPESALNQGLENNFLIHLSIT